MLASRVLIGLLLILVGPVHGEGIGVAPPLAETTAAWFEVRSWLNEGGPPERDRSDARISIPESDRAVVVLRLNGRTVGVGTSLDAGPLALHDATTAAIRDAFADRVLQPFTSEERRRALARLQLEIEIAGKRRPLVGATLAAAASRIRPGLDGMAVRRRQDVAMAFPGRMLSTGTANAQPTTIIRLLRELGLPPKDLPELRRIDSVQLETFESVRIGQDSPDASPRERRRSGEIVPRRPLDRDLVSNLSRDLDERLRRWRPTAPADGGSKDAAKTMWLGDFSPVSDRYQPLEASPTESMVAYWASAEELGAAIPGPVDVDTPSAELVDLALLASSRAGRSDRATEWSVLCEAWTPQPEVVPLARRAAALALADAELVGDEEVARAHESAWSEVDDVTDVVAGFDWLALLELGRTRRGLPRSPRLDSLRAVQDALLLRQVETDGDDDGGIPLSEGVGVSPDARSIRVLLGMAALSEIADEDDARRDRTRRGLEGLIRFVRQLMLDPSEASELRGGRTGVGGVQHSLSDREQSLAATATTRVAIDLLEPSDPTGSAQRNQDGL